MAKLFKIHSSLTLDTRKFTTSLKGASDRVTRFARNMEKTTKRIGKAFKQAGKDLLFIGAAPAAALILSVKNYATMADEIGKLAKQTGLATEALSEYRHVVGITGVAFEKWVDAIRFMQDALSSTIGDAPLKRLGLDKESLKQLAPEEAFEKIVKALGDVGNAADRTGISLDLFGRSGSIILRLVGADFKALREEARKLGLSLSEEQTAAAEKFNDEMLRLTSSIESVSFSIARSLMPAVNVLVVGATDVAIAMQKWGKENILVGQTADIAVKGTAIFTAGLIGAGGLLFAIGQISFAINSMLKLYAAANAASLISARGATIGAVAFLRLGIAVAGVVAVVKLLDKETREEAASFWVAKEKVIRGRLRNIGVNIADSYKTGPFGDTDAFIQRKGQRERRLLLSEAKIYGQASYGPDVGPSAEIAAKLEAQLKIAEKQLEVTVDTNKIQRQSQAGRDALGGSKMQPGGIF